MTIDDTSPVGLATDADLFGTIARSFFHAAKHELSNLQSKHSQRRTFQLTRSSFDASDPSFLEAEAEAEKRLSRSIKLIGSSSRVISIFNALGKMDMSEFGSLEIRAMLLIRKSMLSVAAALQREESGRSSPVAAVSPAVPPDTCLRLADQGGRNSLLP